MIVDLVSVVIPTYNYGEFLGAAVESALNQTYKEIEIVIVDDGSSDNTSVVAEALINKDQRVRYVYQKNQGLSAARNNGIRQSKGKFIVFLDADDIMHPQKIQAHHEHFSRTPDADISYGRSLYFLSQDMLAGVPKKTFANLELTNDDWMPCVSGDATAVFPALVARNIMPVCSAMLRRKTVERVGDFDTSLKSLEDWDYWLRAAAKHCIFSFSEDGRLATYIRVHNISMSQNTLRMMTNQYRLRLDNIPRWVAATFDPKSAQKLLKDNMRRRVRCLTKLHMKQESFSVSLLCYAAANPLLFCFGC